MAGSKCISPRKEIESEPTILVGCTITQDGWDFYNDCYFSARQLHKFLNGGVSIKFGRIISYSCEYRWNGKFIARIFDDQGGYPSEPGFYWAESYVVPVTFKFKSDQIWEKALRLSVQRHIQKDIKSLNILNKRISKEITI
ncbi:MAG: hypothetical protein UT16_C0017G0002 [Candidatus Azambacteria bacterium GW2011_GWA2_39_10]|uniref:Uncharacterized protein n=1 Tax=Candidatus Azambacteria bacterium GW2011_GWA2_39_10 TaxID=1618611 RepID=A0A0G0LJY0_9BACT|nr:MAG: hypothetical protein UT16_C0017G0002 [Candidatus Azambacteria bacterium GW2011_GWA2_39_10]